ncbi:BLUF domain-containing protein [Pararoseomonas sp. SCSIO 73927]|uniref:BLUF domain-containing protein n=1 Tax=Pararoseomonas sp. SCSIO 73927 TaxID=3114537 RepID=UPI0030CB2D96
MLNKIYRLIYVSQNTLHGPVEDMKREVDQILAVSRHNNARDGITGALLFNSSCFAQVLEGELDAVHGVFERIQMDPRHSETVVLACEPASREFGDWSMAYAGAVRNEEIAFSPLAEPAVHQASATRILDLLRGVVLRQGAQ